MTQEKLRLLAVLAHPDDESLGFGGTFAKYADEGVETYLITATRGEHGWFGAPEDYPGETTLGKLRENELRQATELLGIKETIVLDYIDGQLDQAVSDDIIACIAQHIRRIQPDVVITFDPYGAYGHPDHIAICQFTTAAAIKAANSIIDGDFVAHQVKKLYYRVDTRDELAIYEEAFGELAMTIDGIKRQAIGWANWAITTHIDIASYWDIVWQAVNCHQTQIASIQSLEKVAQDDKPIWQSESYYRVFSLVNGGHKTENDLFDSLNADKSSH